MILPIRAGINMKLDEAPTGQTDLFPIRCIPIRDVLHLDFSGPSLLEGLLFISRPGESVAPSLMRVCASSSHHSTALTFHADRKLDIMLANR